MVGIYSPARNSPSKNTRGSPGLRPRKNSIGLPRDSSRIEEFDEKVEGQGLNKIKANLQQAFGDFKPQFVGLDYISIPIVNMKDSLSIDTKTSGVGSSPSKQLVKR